MKEYDVTITETLEKVVTIEAESKEEALKLAEEMWKNADIILDAENFADVDYNVGEGKEIDKSNELEVLLVKPGQYACSALFAPRKATLRVSARLRGAQ